MGRGRVWEGGAGGGASFAWGPRSARSARTPAPAKRCTTQLTRAHPHRPLPCSSLRPAPSRPWQAVATLEGIALLGDPQYQMVAQAYPFVARRVLRNEDSGAGALLRDMLYDSSGQLRPARLSALLQVRGGWGGAGGDRRLGQGARSAVLQDVLYDSPTRPAQVRPPRLAATLQVCLWSSAHLEPPAPLHPPPQAALGYVAAKSEGFIDLDSLPEDGASAQEVRRGAAAGSVPPSGGKGGPPAGLPARPHLP